MPTSQNISNCALIINALCKGIYPPKSLSDYDDLEVMMKALCNERETIDIMVAGTAICFLTACHYRRTDYSWNSICGNASYR
jgi:3-phosphoshikimate 1-carboxyvinyltransferase